MRITTNRLLIREFENNDLHRTWTPGKVADSIPIQPFDLRQPELIHRTVKAALEEAEEVPRHTWDLAVMLAGNEQLIGRAGWERPPDSPGNAMVWFISDPSSWNQGYATEGAKAVVDYCFKELGLHRIWAECDPTNDGAVRLLEGLGLRREGLLVESNLCDGVWCDMAVYAQLQREWKARR